MIRIWIRILDSNPHSNPDPGNFLRPDLDPEPDPKLVFRIRNTGSKSFQQTWFVFTLTPERNKIERVNVCISALTSTSKILLIVILLSRMAMNEKIKGVNNKAGNDSAVMMTPLAVVIMMAPMVIAMPKPGANDEVVAAAEEVMAVDDDCNDHDGSAW